MQKLNKEIWIFHWSEKICFALNKKIKQLSIQDILFENWSISEGICWQNVFMESFGDLKSLRFGYR
jgi:hypothetical protein